MSTRNAIFGFSIAMYEKFCSGPTPMYAPPCCPCFARLGPTCRYDVSFEM